ncbi:hypothetical protein AVEN_118992-1, partial [Araneus ventricosus]
RTDLKANNCQNLIYTYQSSLPVPAESRHIFHRRGSTSFQKFSLLRAYPFPKPMDYGVFVLNLNFHHLSVPIHLENFLVDPFHFQPIKFGGSFKGLSVSAAHMGNLILKATAPPPPSL